MSAGLAGTLYKLLFKINGEDHGFNESWHITSDTPANARDKAVLVATARKRILPSDFEIAYATISNDNTKRDSKFIPTAMGSGTFINSGLDPLPTKVNDDKTAAKIRFENDDGGSNTMLIVGMPDDEVKANALVHPPDALTATYAGDPPVAGDLTLFKLQMENFIKVVSKYCVNVRTGRAPGAVYDYFAYTAAYYVGIGKKKGGRIFVM